MCFPAEGTKKRRRKRSAHTAVLHAVSGSSFEEVLPVIPFPRLCFVFLWRGRLIMSTILLCLRRPLHRKTSQKSLEKGFGGRTFPQKGFPPIVSYKCLYKHHSSHAFCRGAHCAPAVPPHFHLSTVNLYTLSTVCKLYVKKTSPPAPTMVFSTVCILLKDMPSSCLLMSPYMPFSQTG